MRGAATHPFPNTEPTPFFPSPSSPGPPEGFRISQRASGLLCCLSVGLTWVNHNADEARLFPHINCCESSQSSTTSGNRPCSQLTSHYTVIVGQPPRCMLVITLAHPPFAATPLSLRLRRDRLSALDGRQCLKPVDRVRLRRDPTPGLQR
ncbi:hypothetical protein BaRGS_00007274 [Batillaria attramentaria]|uniref:Uncharacterized protein n=1 Tax=Batillaria attramentaria TaxID=370345 RepID=A0ABD0LPK4_9CAEN